MLTQLVITNFVLIKYLDLAIPPNFISFTGETGAGKSIILDALGLILGDRSRANLIYPESDKAQICALFDITESLGAVTWLDEHGYDTNICQLKRIIHINGTTKCYINNFPANVQDIKSLGNLLVNIHHQHGHQDLLITDKQRELFDQFIGCSELAQQLATIYTKWNKSHTLLNQELEGFNQLESQIKFLTEQADEVAALNIGENELEDLEDEQKRHGQINQIIHNLNQALNLCYCDNLDETPNISRSMHQALQLLDNIDDQHSSLVAAKKMLSDASIYLEETVANLRSYADVVEHNPAREQQIQARLDAIYSVASKYNYQPQELLAQQDGLNHKIESLHDKVAKYKELIAQVAMYLSQYNDLAAQLSSQRSAKTSYLEDQVNACLQKLHMRGSYFQVRLTPKQDMPSKGGNEKVEFLISTNERNHFGALKLIASGGELSRISLAIQVVLAYKTKLPTLIFDEVDSGIGGNTASVVGTLLRSIGQNSQVVCITHQAQVAACAHDHFFIDKNEGVSSIAHLDANQRIAEIMRMLGGTNSASSKQHAKEILITGQSAAS